MTVQDWPPLALLERCRRGEPEAWEELVPVLRPRLEGWVRRWVEDPDRAADVVQTALLQVWRSLPGLRDPRAFWAWVHRILRNAACRAVRPPAAGGFTEVPLAEEREGSAGSDPDPDLRLTLEQAVGRLPQEYREVFLLVDLLRCPLQEVARRLQLPVGTVKSRLFRARRRIRRDLEEGLGGEEATLNPEREEDQIEQDRIYDFLEGHLSAPEENAFRRRLEGDAALAQRTERARSFLQVLHGMTGRLGLTAREIAHRVEEVETALRDYRAVQTRTYWREVGEPLQKT